jgi:hypothetical protein
VNTKHAAILATLGLANNGYTFRYALSLEQITAAEAARRDGLVGRQGLNKPGTSLDVSVYYIIGATG